MAERQQTTVTNPESSHNIFDTSHSRVSYTTITDSSGEYIRKEKQGEELIFSFSIDNGQDIVDVFKSVLALPSFDTYSVLNKDNTFGIYDRQSTSIFSLKLASETTIELLPTGNTTQSAVAKVYSQIKETANTLVTVTKTTITY